MAIGSAPIGSAPIGSLPFVTAGAELESGIPIDVDLSGDLDVSNSGDMATSASIDVALSGSLESGIDFASSVDIDVDLSATLSTSSSPFDFPNSQYLALTPLINSFSVDDIEAELKDLFIELFDDLLASTAFDVNVLGAAHLGSFNLVRRAINEDGLVLLPGERENPSTRYLYRAWKSRNVQGRGLHFLRTYLQLLFPNFWSIDQMMQDKAEAYPTALFPYIVAGNDSDKFLTSRINITIDTAGSIVDLDKYISSIVSVIPARMVPRFALTTSRGANLAIAARGNLSMTLRAISNIYANTYISQLRIAARGNLSTTLQGSGTVYAIDTPSGSYQANRPYGIYSLDGIVDKSFVSGMLKRSAWGDFETSQGVYNFSAIDTALGQVEAVGQKLTLVIFAISGNFGPGVPQYVIEGSATWTNPAYSNTKSQVIPWDAFAISRWQVFCEALANHTYNGVRLADHPALAQMDCSIGGTQGVRLLQLPTGYTAALYKQACIDWISAMIDNFKDKNCYVGMFGVEDNATPKTADAIRDALLSKYNGVSQPRINFYIEFLTGLNPTTTSTTGKLLAAVKDQTSIMFQSCWAWSDQATGTSKSGCSWATSDTPQKGVTLGLTYNGTYYEFYNADLNKTEYQTQLAQIALDIKAKHDQLIGQVSTGSTIGFVGASMSMNAVDGAGDLGDTRFWHTVTTYSSGGIWQWAQNLTNTSTYWSAFNSAYQARPATTFWLQFAALESFQANETFTNALAIVNQIKTRAPGAVIYVSAQPTYIPTDHVCTIAGANGPARMQAIADQLVSAGHCLAGPVIGPLNYPSQTIDSCHGNTAGEQAMGQQLINFFSSI